MLLRTYSCEHQPSRTADFGAPHGKHQSPRIRGRLEPIDVDYAILDGVGNASSQCYSSRELCDYGQETNLWHG
jgi:hypothetical protein